MGERVGGKVVAVTGAAAGIGRGCAEMLAREGAKVVLADIQDEAGESAAEAIRTAGGEARYVHADVTREEECRALMEAAVEAYGALNGLVNNVGWFPRATLEETTLEMWEKVLRVNLYGAFFCCKHAVPHLRAAGGGSIVNMGSIHGIQAFPNLVAYGAAKGGLLTLTRTVAGAYAREYIRCNYVIPGWVLTEAEIALQRSQGVTEEEMRRAGEALPLGRHQTVEDAAYAVLYLMSDESAQVTGTVLSVDAGSSTLPHQSLFTS